MMKGLTEQEKLLIRSAMGIFLAREWVSAPDILARWILQCTGYPITEEQVQECLEQIAREDRGWNRN